jgi:D-glycero-D-manno-heptose 1,7-bisphosphate phosphatase
MFPGLLLDRDGVIIEHRSDYVRTLKDVFIFPQALTALAWVDQYQYRTAIITNQSGIGRGLIDPHESRLINQKIIDEITQAGGHIDAVFVCPHRPEDQCDCRKPKPGLILKAAEFLGLDLSRSILIGDNLKDILAGGNGGVGKLVLVRTGLGKQQETLPLPKGMPGFQVFDDLLSAVKGLLP